MAALCALVMLDNTLKMGSHQCMTVAIVDTIVYIGQSLGILLGAVLFTLSEASGMLQFDITCAIL